METLECIETRRSVRKFLDIPVEFDKVGNILNAGRLAPSAGNLQDWKFVLVTELNLLKELSEACTHQHWMAKAPVHIVICSKASETDRMYGKRGRELFSVQNCAAAAQNMLLAAHDQGLGACFVSAFEDHMVRRTLSMPDDVRPMVVIPIGYPDETPKQPTKHNIDNVTYIERWGNRIKDFAAYVGYYSHHIAHAALIGKEKLRQFLEKWSK